jgi:hypothetical protein
MKPFRVLMMLTALLATATVVHGQSPGNLPPLALYPLPEELESLAAAAQASRVECNMTPPAWYTQALQQGAATWQRLRAICSTGKQDSTCCEAASAKQASGALGLAGSVKSCATAQAPKACACVKPCACCEACKEKKETTPPVQAQRMELTAEMMKIMAGLRGIAPLQPAPPFPVIGVPPCVPPVQGPGIAQFVPLPGVRVVQIVQVARHVKPVHLVTPDLEAHCERMHHRGDAIVLEGNVLLLCRKHAQPIRIEAQRVIVNMRDGSFSVESDVRPVSSSSFGVQRTSAVPPGGVSQSRVLRAFPAAGVSSSGVWTTSKDIPVNVQEMSTGTLMLGAGANSDNGVTGTNVGHSVPGLREIPSNCFRPTGPPVLGPERAREVRAPSQMDLEALFRFWTEMYR